MEDGADAGSVAAGSQLWLSLSFNSDAAQERRRFCVPRLMCEQRCALFSASLAA